MEEGRVSAFCEAFASFLADVAKGHESGFYRFFAAGGAPITDLQSAQLMLPLIATCAERFWNNMYNGLVDAAQIQNGAQATNVKSFRAILDMLPAHSPVCLINMAFRLYTEIHQKLDRSEFALSTYELYMRSAEAQIDASVADLRTATELFSHVCQGGPLTPLPAGKQQFAATLGPTICCAGCGKPSELVGPLKRCGGCRKVSYCSEECQRAHRKAHRPDCFK